MEAQALSAVSDHALVVVDVPLQAASHTADISNLLGADVTFHGVYSAGN